MSGLISLKITIEQEANYLLFGDRICRDVKELNAFCLNRYQDLHKNVDDFRYYWIDDDGDEIRITTDEDYQSFLQAMVNAKARLFVVGKNTPLVETSIREEPAVHAETGDVPMQKDATSDDVTSRPVHQHTICDVCDELIVGHRYKCLTCHDYDLCMNCEAKFRHKDHLMLRIPKPAMVNRSQSTVSRMLDKLRVYSSRITSNVEKEAGLDAETNGSAGNENPETAGTRRANARSVYRSKHSEERRTNETSKSSRSGKSCGNDRKQHSSAGAAETSGERCSRETKEKPSVPSLSEMTQRCRDMMFMYLNSVDALDTEEKSVPWSTNDHVAVANVAAATANAAAARAAAIASKVMNAKVAPKNDKPSPSQEPAQPSVDAMQQILRQTYAQKPVAPVSYLPFVNLGWPSQEKLMSASENISKLLDPLGLSFELRHKSATSPSTASGCSKPRGCAEDGAVPSTSAAVGETTSSIPTTSTAEPAVVQQEKKQVKIVEPNKSTAVEETFSTAQELPTLAVPVFEQSNEKDVEAVKASVDDKAEIPQAKKTTSAKLESDSVCEKKPEAEAENEVVDDEDDSQNTSSASLLTDDDQDLLDVAEDEEKGSTPSKPSAEKAWTLIDLPEEHDEERIANAPLDAIAKLIGRDLSSPDKEPLQSKSISASKEKKKDRTTDEKQKELKKSAVPGKSSADRENEYEMFRKMITEQTGRSDRSVEVDKPQSPTVAAKEVKAISASPPNSGPSSSSSGSSSRSGKSSRKSSSSAQQKDFTVYSHRPHVNHAIHTMMTMGFSNHNGWLTQLLESLNGDIPKALDLLLQHRH
uniref:ZZ-type domain-containing protein n=1 Tax=Anopheles funestus TaxID=62324 RepID=A0A182RRA3_ANOFN